jgi:hypothetical protein
MYEYCVVSSRIRSGDEIDFGGLESISSKHRDPLSLEQVRNEHDTHSSIHTYALAFCIYSYCCALDCCRSDIASLMDWLMIAWRFELDIPCW